MPPAPTDPTEDAPPYDVIVVGAGPVGLHAALKAAVLNHTVLVVDRGREFSRVSQAPAIANIPGAPGISGTDLLKRGRESLRDFRDLAGKDLVTLVEGVEAVSARRDEEGRFTLTIRPREGGDPRDVHGRVLILATGTVDRKPGISAFYRRGHATVSPFLARGEVGYCILCEGWALEHADVAIIGAIHESVQVALDVRRQFGGKVTLLTDCEPLAEADAEARLHEAGVRIDDRAIEGFGDMEGRIEVRFQDGGATCFDKAFFCLGWYKVNNELAVLLGARTNDEGYVVTDENCEVLDHEGNPIRGLFAVGDVRAGRWKQIVVGWGDAETAVITAYAFRLPSAAEARDEVPNPPPA